MREFLGEVPFLLFLLGSFVIFNMALGVTRGMSSKDGGLFGMTNSKAKLHTGTGKPAVTFADVAGLDEAKVEIMEFVHFLKKTRKIHCPWCENPKRSSLSWTARNWKDITR
jgi:cell division protease FtsH